MGSIWNCRATQHSDLQEFNASEVERTAFAFKLGTNGEFWVSGSNEVKINAWSWYNKAVSKDNFDNPRSLPRTWTLLLSIKMDHYGQWEIIMGSTGILNMSRPFIG